MRNGTIMYPFDDAIGSVRHVRTSASDAYFFKWWLKVAAISGLVKSRHQALDGL